MCAVSAMLYQRSSVWSLNVFSTFISTNDRHLKADKNVIRIQHTDVNDPIIWHNRSKTSYLNIPNSKHSYYTYSGLFIQARAWGVERTCYRHA